MADITVTFPDAQYNGVVNAFAANYAADLKAGETSVQLMQRKVGEYCASIVRAAKGRAASQAAYNTAVTAVDNALATTVTVTSRSTTGV